LAHPAVTSAICGAKSSSQVEENCGAGRWQLSSVEREEINILIEGLSQGE
jgi:aryl-alcohol dehydrogenase-like predicted oxidoreductase